MYSEPVGGRTSSRITYLLVCMEGRVIQRVGESASRRVGGSAGRRVGESASRRVGESVRVAYRIKSVSRSVRRPSTTKPVLSKLVLNVASHSVLDLVSKFVIELTSE